MKLNQTEKFLMNNPIRAFIQKRVEAPLLQNLGGDVVGQRVLEVGCGRGQGVKILFDCFGAKHVTAFDLDKSMIEDAERRLSKYKERVRLYVGDATQIPEDDSTFDAVFDFGIIHHIPCWEDAISEISRVLKPGGKFYFEEVTQKALNRWFYRKFLEHPKENRFNSKTFLESLEKHELSVNGKFLEKFFGDFLIGVATK